MQDSQASASPQSGAPAPVCQLEGAVAGERPPSGFEARLRRLRQALLLGRLRVAKLMRDPGLLLRKLREGRSAPAPHGSQVACPAVLELRPGERVRVRSEADIAATLDARAKLDGLGFVPDTMSRFCGGTFTVRQRVDHFFDERTRRMLKPRNVVILDTVYCEPPTHMQSDFAGCQRACFLFWKEAWLQRSDD